MASDKNGWTDGDDLKWDDVSTEAPAPLEDGIYKIEITKTEPATAKSGSKMVNFEARVTAKYGGGEASRTLRYNNLVFHKDALWKAKQMATACGVPLPASTRFEDLETFGDSLLDSAGCFARVGRDIGKNGRVFNTLEAFLTEEEAAKAAEGPDANEAAASGSARKRRPAVAA